MYNLKDIESLNIMVLHPQFCTLIQTSSTFNNCTLTRLLSKYFEPKCMYQDSFQQFDCEKNKVISGNISFIILLCQAIVLSLVYCTCFDYYFT